MGTNGAKIAACVEMDARTLLRTINSGALSQHKIFEDKIKWMGQKQGYDFRLMSVNQNSLIYEDVNTGQMYQADVKRLNRGRIRIENSRPLRIIESQKKSLFKKACLDLVESIAEDDDGSADVAFGRMQNQHFRSRTIPRSGHVVTRDGIARHIPVSEDLVPYDLKPQIVKTICDSLSDRVMIKRGQIVESTFNDSDEKIRIPINELTRRRVVARLMKECAKEAYTSKGFQDRVRQISGYFSNQKFTEGAKAATGLLRDKQEFCLLNLSEMQHLVGNALAARGVLNEKLADDVGLLFYKANCKVNNKEIIESWKKTAKLAEHPKFVENVKTLEESDDFENDYGKFLETVFDEDRSTKDIRAQAYLTSLEQIRRVIEGTGDDAVLKSVDDYILKLKQDSDSIDDSVLYEVEDLLSSISTELIHDVRSLADYDEIPEPPEAELDQFGDQDLSAEAGKAPAVPLPMGELPSLPAIPGAAGPEGAALPGPGAGVAPPLAADIDRDEEPILEISPEQRHARGMEHYKTAGAGAPASARGAVRGAYPEDVRRQREAEAARARSGARPGAARPGAARPGAARPEAATATAEGKLPAHLEKYKKKKKGEGEGDEDKETKKDDDNGYSDKGKDDSDKGKDEGSDSDNDKGKDENKGHPFGEAFDFSGMTKEQLKEELEIWQVSGPQFFVESGPDVCHELITQFTDRAIGLGSSDIAEGFERVLADNLLSGQTDPYAFDVTAEDFFGIDPEYGLSESAVGMDKAPGKGLSDRSATEVPGTDSSSAPAPSGAAKDTPSKQPGKGLTGKGSKKDVTLPEAVSEAVGMDPAPGTGLFPKNPETSDGRSAGGATGEKMDQVGGKGIVQKSTTKSDGRTAGGGSTEAMDKTGGKGVAGDSSTSDGKSAAGKAVSEAHTACPHCNHDTCPPSCDCPSGECPGKKARDAKEVEEAQYKFGTRRIPRNPQRASLGEDIDAAVAEIAEIIEEQDAAEEMDNVENLEAAEGESKDAEVKAESEKPEGEKKEVTEDEDVTEPTSKAYTSDKESRKDGDGKLMRKKPDLKSGDYHGGKGQTVPPAAGFDR